jgi:hypothetical protein
MPTMDEIRAKIKRNFPKEAQSRREALPLQWTRETGTTMVTSCGNYRICKYEDGARDVFAYFAFTVPTPTSAARKIAGPFVTPKECRDAVQDFVNGMPMQADLA